MISPYVLRLRLGTELRALRAEAGLTHEQVAKRIGESRVQISRLENGHVVDLADVMKILDAPVTIVRSRLANGDGPGARRRLCGARQRRRGRPARRRSRLLHRW